MRKYQFSLSPRSLISISLFIAETLSHTKPLSSLSSPLSLTIAADSPTHLQIPLISGFSLSTVSHLSFSLSLHHWNSFTPSLSLLSHPLWVFFGVFFVVSSGGDRQVIWVSSSGDRWVVWVSSDGGFVTNVGVGQVEQQRRRGLVVGFWFWFWILILILDFGFWFLIFDFDLDLRSTSDLLWILNFDFGWILLNRGGWCD